MAEVETNQESPTSSRSVARELRRDVMTLTKARLSILVVITSIFGFLIATKGGEFSPSLLFHVFLGSILAAFGAAVFNQLMEVDVDARMKRTSDRPLPANRMPRAVAFVLGWLFCAFGIMHLGVKVNVMASAMAGITLLTYLFIYTPMKRVSTFNTVVGAVSGAIPPLIGWTGGGGAFFSDGALFLFLLLFLWQMPHFAAINWMYREEYARGGFKMWSNDDETGAKTAKIALFFAVLTFLFGVIYPLVSDSFFWWGCFAGGALGAVMVYFAIKFLKSGERSDARTLFFYTLLHLPLMMVASYLAWA
ncbi:heme o synthase [Verrucomicrobiales bacterium]|nr:heme o synthase [Verrucomicrobiales bacterium]MDA7926520.1 heme o synthase [Verrucomicrobiales bacterium]